LVQTWKGDGNQGTVECVSGMIYFYLPQVRGDTYNLTGSDSILIPRFQNLSDERSHHLRGFGYWCRDIKRARRRKTRSAATREAALARLDLDAGVEVGC
jgi:hypothetical protein